MKSDVTRVLIAALGGEGGGVLAEWLVLCARQAGWVAQATSVPGVAQRTGSTSYYIEWVAEGGAPVLALSPMPGRVDVVVASEWLETARMMERGFVTPELTTLIASTSRVFTTHEKMHGADGRFDPDRIRSLALTLAQRAVLMDMEALTIEHRTVVSAVMFGAMAGAGVLPWSDEISQAVIRASGKGVKASLAAFEAAKLIAAKSVRTSTGAASANANQESAHTADTEDAGDAGQTSAIAAEHRSSELLQLIDLGAARCEDYQDARYAAEFRQRVREAIPSGSLSAQQTALWSDAVRQLALWMCFEDVVRVADLKTRRDRIQRIRREAQAASNELVHVTEHFKPGVDEIASILPAGLGRSLLSWSEKRPERARHVGLHIRTTSLWGYLMLRALARLRPWRRSSLRFNEEHIAIDVWWTAFSAVAPQSPALGQALAQLPQVLKGYGETQRRGREHYERLWTDFVAPALTGQLSMDQAATQLQQAFKATLAKPDAPATSSHGQTIRWFKQRPAD